jgi:hypothetical protein
VIAFAIYRPAEAILQAALGLDYADEIRCSCAFILRSGLGGGQRKALQLSQTAEREVEQKMSNRHS